MAVVFGYPKELPNTPSTGDESQYRHGRRFLVITDDVDDGTPVALSATGIPRVGDAHPSQGFAYCKRVSAEADSESRLKFMVTAEYETPPRSTEPGGDNPDPLMRPSEYAWQWVSRNEPVRFGKFTKKIKVQRNGTVQEIASNFASVAKYPVQNSAKMPTDPLPERPISSPVLRVARNQATFDAASANNYIDHINADQFSVAGSTIAIGQGYMRSITATRQFENNVYYWRVEYELEFRADSWYVDILDHGDHERIDENNQIILRPIGSSEFPRDKNLDGAGRALADVPDNGGAATDIVGVYLRYEFAQSAVFGSLNL